MPAVTLEVAREQLSKLKDSIVLNHPTPKEIPEIITKYTPSQNGKEIRYFLRLNKSIKDAFNQHRKIPDGILHLNVQNPPTTGGAGTGQIWHNSLKRCIPTPDPNEKGQVVIDAVTEWLKSDGGNVLQLLQSEFPLYGYMKFEEDVRVPETSFWEGNVDAVGWYKGNYVIVEWKTVDLLDFWETNRQAYVDFLHQCLVYARLLQLHLELNELPYILIVPINNKTDMGTRPSLFYNFPQQCKDELNQYQWSATLPWQTRSLPIGMVKTENCILDENNFIINKKKVSEVLKDDCTVQQLLDSLRLELIKLKIV